MFKGNTEYPYRFGYITFTINPFFDFRIPGSHVWSALFFLMLITLALGSIFGAFETVITAMSDQWPVLRDCKPQLVVLTSMTMLILGLPFCCNGKQALKIKNLHPKFCISDSFCRATFLLFFYC